MGRWKGWENYDPGARLAVEDPPPSGGEPKKHKYGAKKVVIDGIRFDSKKEGKYYEQLKMRVMAGEVSYFLRQVPLHLPGGTILRVDFVEFWTDNTVHWIDVKGYVTDTFKIKKREVEAHYPITIETT